MDSWPRRPRAHYSAEEADRFRKALELVATSSSAPEGFYFGLAVQSYLLGDNLSAIDFIYDHLDDSGQDDVQSHLLLGKIHTELEEIQQAEESFKQVLKLDPINVEAHLRYAWLKLHRGLNHDHDLAVATTLLESLEQENKKTRNSIFSAEQERVFLDLRCELLGRLSTTSTVSSMKLQSLIQAYPKHVGLHLLLLETFKISGDYSNALSYIEKNSRIMRHEKRWWEAGLIICNAALGQTDPMFPAPSNLHVAPHEVYRVKLLCCDSLLGIVTRRLSSSVSNQSVEMLLQTYSETLKAASSLDVKDDAFANIVTEHRSRLQVRTAEAFMRRRNWHQARQALQAADNSRLETTDGKFTLDTVKQLEFKSHLARTKYDLAVLEAAMSSASDSNDIALDECLSIDSILIRECGIVASDLNAVVDTLVWYLNRGLIDAAATVTGALFGELPAIVSGEESSVYSELALELEFFLLKHAVKNAIPSSVDQILSQLRHDAVPLHPLALLDAESHSSVSEADSNDTRLWQHALLYLQLATNTALDDVEKTISESTPQSRWGLASKAALLSQRVAGAIGSPGGSSGGILLPSPAKKAPRAYLPESVDIARRRMNFYAVEGSPLKTEAVAAPPQKLDGRGIVVQSLKTKRECLLADQVLIATVQLMQARAQGYQQLLQGAHARSSAINYARHWAQSCIDFFGDILKQVNVIAQEVVEGEEMDRILVRASPAFVSYGHFWESLRRYLISKDPTPTEEAQMEHEEDTIFSLLLEASTPDTLLLLSQLLHARFEVIRKKNSGSPLPAGKVSQAIDCLERLLRAPALSAEQEKRRSRLIADLGLFGITPSKRRSVSGRSPSPRGGSKSRSPRSGSASSAPNESGDEVSADEMGDDEIDQDYNEAESNDESFDEDKYESDDASEDEFAGKQTSSLLSSKRSLINTVQRRTSPSPVSKRGSSPSPSPSRRNVSSSPGPGARSGSSAPAIPLPQIPVENIPTMQSRLSELSKLRAQTQQVMQAKKPAAAAESKPRNDSMNAVASTSLGVLESGEKPTAKPAVASVAPSTSLAPASAQTQSKSPAILPDPPIMAPKATEVKIERPTAQPVSPLATPFGGALSFNSSPFGASGKGTSASFVVPTIAPSAMPSTETPTPADLRATTSFGGSNTSKEPISTFASHSQTPVSAGPKPSTPFGSQKDDNPMTQSPFGFASSEPKKDNNTVVPSGNNGPEPKKEDKPAAPFGFGSSEPKKDDKPAAPFGFGSSELKKDDKPATPFGFGASEPKKEDKPASEPKKEDKPAAPFGFGASEPKKEDKPAAPFGFGASEPKKDDKPATPFGFGASEPKKEDKPASEPKKEDKPAAPFGFGSSEPKKEDKPAAPFGFGSSEPKKDDKPVTPFGFGASESKKEDKPAAPFGFGASVSKKDENPTTPFGFGSSEPNKDDKPSMSFGFGASEPKKDDLPAAPFGSISSEHNKDGAPSLPFGSITSEGTLSGTGAPAPKIDAPFGAAVGFGAVSKQKDSSSDLTPSESKKDDKQTPSTLGVTQSKSDDMSTAPLDLASEPKKEHNPTASFGFGAAGARQDDKHAASFGFGTAEPTKINTPVSSFGFGATEPAKDNKPVPAAGFGIPEPKKDEPTTSFGFGPVESKQDSKPTSFSLGTAQPKSDDKPAPSLSFGSTEPKQDDKPGTSFGFGTASPKKVDEPAQSFGFTASESKSEDEPISPVAFRVSEPEKDAKPATTFGFGSSDVKKDDKSVNSFSFDTSENGKDDKPATPFGFGIAEPKPAAPFAFASTEPKRDDKATSSFGIATSGPTKDAAFVSGSSETKLAVVSFGAASNADEKTATRSATQSDDKKTAEVASDKIEAPDAPSESATNEKPESAVPLRFGSSPSSSLNTSSSFGHGPSEPKQDHASTSTSFSFSGSFDASKSSVLSQVTFSNGDSLRAPQSSVPAFVGKLSDAEKTIVDSSSISFGVPQTVGNLQSEKSPEKPNAPPAEQAPASDSASKNEPSSSLSLDASAAEQIPRPESEELIKEELSESDSEASDDDVPACQAVGFSPAASFDPSTSSVMKDVALAPVEALKAPSVQGATTSVLKLTDAAPGPSTFSFGAPVSSSKIESESRGDSSAPAGFTFSSSFDPSKSSVLSNTTLSHGADLKLPNASVSTGLMKLDAPSPADFDISKISFGSTAEAEDAPGGSSDQPSDSMESSFEKEDVPTDSEGVDSSVPESDHEPHEPASQDSGSDTDTEGLILDEGEEVAPDDVKVQGKEPAKQAASFGGGFGAPATPFATPFGSAPATTFATPFGQSNPAPSTQPSMPFGQAESKPTNEERKTTPPSFSFSKPADTKTDTAAQAPSTSVDASSKPPQAVKFATFATVGEEPKPASAPISLGAGFGIGVGAPSKPFSFTTTQPKQAATAPPSTSAQKGPSPSTFSFSTFGSALSSAPSPASNSSKDAKQDNLTSESESRSGTPNASTVTSKSLGETNSVTSAEKANMDNPKTSSFGLASGTSKPTSSVGFGLSSLSAVPVAASPSSGGFGASSFSNAPLTVSPKPASAGGFGLSSLSAAPASSNPPAVAPKPASSVGFGLSSLSAVSTTDSSNPPSSGGFVLSSFSNSLPTASTTTPPPSVLGSKPRETHGNSSDESDSDHHSDSDDDDDEAPALSLPAMKPGSFSFAKTQPTPASPASPGFKPSSFGNALGAFAGPISPAPSMSSFSFQSSGGQGVNAFSAAPSAASGAPAFSARPADGGAFGSSTFGQASRLGAATPAFAKANLVSPSGVFGSASSKSSFASVAASPTPQKNMDEDPSESDHDSSDDE